MLDAYRKIGDVLPVDAEVVPADAFRSLREELLDHISFVLTRTLNETPREFSLMLYRLDIDEKKVNELLRKHDRKEATQKIAVLILDRQTQKAITRAQYRSKQEGTSPAELPDSFSK